MIDRRTFMGGLSGLGFLGVSPAAEAAKRRVFVFEQYFLKNGTQAGRFHEYVQKTALPALGRVSPGPRIVLEALTAPHMPQVATLLGFASVEELWSAREKLLGDEEWRKGFEAWENHAEQPYEHLMTTLLELTDYCPSIPTSLEPRSTPRIFEIRVYHSPTWRQLRALHERFAGPEIQIFHRVGVHPILYSSAVFGGQMPNLTYVIPFDDLAAREKAWNAFGADPEWVKVRKESIDKHGQISSTSQVSLYRATAYSPIR
jgi:hypothetical protein